MNQPPPAQKTSPLAIISLVLSCSSIVMPIFVSPLGILFGHLALWQVRRNPQLGGRTMAKWGLGIGYFLLVAFILLQHLVRAMFRGF
jgi:peptidyl-prolyl cis-trans isomerase B (cyclophilin B)